MNTVKRWLAAFLSAAMIFTGAGFSSIGTVASFAAGTVAIVDNNDGSTANVKEYDNFDTALTETINEYNNGDINKKNKEKSAVIKLQADTSTSGASIAMPLTIDLNGHKLTETEKLTGGVADGKEYCRADKDGKIIFAEHNPTYIANWKYDSTAEAGKKWEVVSVTWVCDNCGTGKYDVTPESTVYDEASKTYSYSDDNVKATKTEDADKAGNYLYSQEAYIVCVNDVVQHENSLPVVNALLTDKASGAPVAANITVTAATAAELKTAKVFEADGKTPFTEDDNNKYNTDATCKEYGTRVYKVVVKDPDGVTLDTKYLRDHQAIEKLAHIKGALSGYEIATMGEGEYATEAAAKAACAAADKTYVKTTTTTNGKYAYWYWDFVEVKETKAATITPDKATQINSDGSFTYRLAYKCDFAVTNKGTDCGATLYDDAVTVNPLPDATTAAEGKDGKHSLCVTWKYASFEKTYEWTRQVGNVVKNKVTTVFTIADIDKDTSAYSHKDNGKRYVYDEVKDTCENNDNAEITCLICGEDTTVPLPHTWGTTTTKPAADKLPVPDGVEAFAANRSVTLENKDGATFATVAATCELPGAVYKYCTGKTYNHGNPHWAYQSTIPANGHNYAPIAVDNGDWDISNKKDITFTGTLRCSVCESPKTVVFHSAAGIDKTETIDNDTVIEHRYSAISISDPQKGKDCKTNAVTVYTVIGVTYSTGKAITKSEEKPDTKGDHVIVMDNFNWSDDYEKATVTGTCSVCKEAGLTANAAVTKTTASDGVTTFTATYGDKSETKKAYTMNGAVVTFDASEITDTRLLDGVEMYASSKAPEVTLTINGTVIDKSVYEVKWNIEDNETEGVSAQAKIVSAIAKFKDKKDSDIVSKAKQAVSAEYNKIEKLELDTPFTTVITQHDDGKDFTVDSGYYEYDDSISYSVKTTSTKGATVKYAITNEYIGTTTAEEKADPEYALERKVEALDFNLDSVDDIKDAGFYYVYAQISKDGYTTYTYADPVAELIIGKQGVTLLMDDITITEGETPKLNLRAVDEYGVTDSRIDVSLFDVVTAGGQSLEGLKAGTYKLVATAKNYGDAWNISYMNKDYLANLTVLPKAEEPTEKPEEPTTAPEPTTQPVSPTTEIKVVEVEKTPVAGKTYKVNGATYLFNANKTVTLYKSKNYSSVIVRDYATIYGKNYKVVGIASKAFASASKVKNVTIKNKRLTKKSVKNSLKGSKVKTITVKVGSTATNKKYMNKYKSYFAKSNSGKKVTMKYGKK